MFKLTVKEHSESDKPLIEAEFILLEQIKSVYFLGTPGIHGYNSFLLDSIILETAVSQTKS